MHTHLRHRQTVMSLIVLTSQLVFAGDSFVHMLHHIHSMSYPTSPRVKCTRLMDAIELLSMPLVASAPIQYRHIATGPCIGHNCADKGMLRHPGQAASAIAHAQDHLSEDVHGHESIRNGVQIACHPVLAFMSDNDSLTSSIPAKFKSCKLISHIVAPLRHFSPLAACQTMGGC